MKEEAVLRPVAHMESDFPEKFGVPRQSGRVKELRADVVFEPGYSLPEAFRGIERFSHLWLIWGFSLLDEKEAGAWSPTVRPPRLGGNKRVGVFASRSPNRPNPLGLSLVELVSVSRRDGRVVLTVGGADLVSGTPIYDVKPYLPASDSAPDARGGYADEFLDYALEVSFPPELLKEIPQDKQEALFRVLREDPRPSYHESGREYGLTYAGSNVSFFVDDRGVLRVTGVRAAPDAEDRKG